MGANATTFVPAYVSGEVLTAADLTVTNSGVPVFADTTARDAAFGGAGEKTLAEGQLCYLESTNKVQYYDGAAWANLGSVTKVVEFTASGSWTVPAGVTWANATIIGGGGGVGAGTNAGAGGNSSVAFASGTITANGGAVCQVNGAGQEANAMIAGANYTGQGAQAGFGAYGSDFAVSYRAGNGQVRQAGATVTPAASITITVGAGGVAGTGGAKGGDGYVVITYQE